MGPETLWTLLHSIKVNHTASVPKLAFAEAFICLLYGDLLDILQNVVYSHSTGLGPSRKHTEAAIDTFESPVSDGNFWAFFLESSLVWGGW